jgi:hypothetical protein
MIFRKAVLLLAAVASSATIAHAQFGVYGTVTVNRLSGQQGSPFATGNVNNSVDPLGGGGGIYYDFKTLGPVRLGADLRGTITNSKQGAYTDFRGSGTRIYSTLGGLRASFHTPWIPVKPYVQISAGLGRSDYGLFTNGTIQVHSNFQFEGFGGVDVKLLPVLDFRVVELGYGALTNFGANGHTYPIGSLSSGIVFHLP